MIKSLNIAIVFNIIYALIISSLFVYVLKPYFSIIDMNNPIIAGTNIVFIILLVITILKVYSWFINADIKVMSYCIFFIL